MLFFDFDDDHDGDIVCVLLNCLYTLISKHPRLQL